MEEMIKNSVHIITLLVLISWPMLGGWMAWEDIKYREIDGIVGKMLHVISLMVIQCMIVALGVTAIWIYLMIVNNVWINVFGGAV